MAHEGKLTPHMDIRNGESGNWFPAEEIGGLFDPDANSTSNLSSEMPSLDDFSIVDSSFGVESTENLPSLDGFSIIEEEDKLSNELESQLPRFATLEAVRSKHEKVQWFCRILNQELGPMSADDLMQLLIDGELAPNDDVKSSVGQEWVPARTVVFLSSAGSLQDDLDIEEEEEEENETSTTSESETTETEQESETETVPEEKAPPKPPILKVRSKQKWFCKLGGMGYGPLEAHKIKAWAEQDRIEATDLLKLGRKAEWFEAWQIEALQLKKPEEKKPEEEAPDNENGATPSDEPKTQETKVAAAPPTMPAQPVTPPTASVPPPRSKPQIKVARSNPFESLGPLMTPQVLGGVAAAIALAALFYFVPLGDLFGPGGTDELIKFQEVHKEFLALQEKQASDAEWTSFKKKVETEIDPLTKELEANASTQYPHIQHLMWAGRDYLHPMLDNARKKEKQNPDQKKFEDHLREAEQIINKK